MGLLSSSVLLGCSDTQDKISDPATSDAPATLETFSERPLTFAEIVGIDLKSLPEQITEGESYIERIEPRVPRNKTRYEYSGTNENSEFCQAFYAAFKQDERDFIRIVQTSGDFSKYSFDARFNSYLEPKDVKGILSQLDFPSVPWTDVPKGVEAARQAYKMHHSDFSYTPAGKRQPGLFARQTLDDFLETLPPNYKPYELYQIYRVENSNYTLFRTEGTDLFDPNLQEVVKLAVTFPSQFPSYRHQLYNSIVMHTGGRDYARDNSSHLMDFMTHDGISFVNLSGSNFRTGLLGAIHITRLDTKLPPAPSRGFDCSISVYLNPKAKFHLEE